MFGFVANNSEEGRPQHSNSDKDIGNPISLWKSWPKYDLVQLVYKAYEHGGISRPISIRSLKMLNKEAEKI